MTTIGPSCFLQALSWLSSQRLSLTLSRGTTAMTSVLSARCLLPLISCAAAASNNLQTGNLRVLILQLQALLIDLPEAVHSPLHDMVDEPPVYHGPSVARP